MALSPEDYYAHVLAGADAEGRLAPGELAEWEVFPFETEGLRVVPFRPPVVPDPPRHGEDGADCSSCEHRDEGLWLSDHFRLTRIGDEGVPLVLMLHPRDHYDQADLPDELAAELGVLTAHVVRHVEALDGISRCHVYRIGDGGAHLHTWFFARPAGQSQMFGSMLVVWDDLVPRYPEDVASADADRVVDALIASYGGSRAPA